MGADSASAGSPRVTAAGAIEAEVLGTDPCNFRQCAGQLDPAGAMQRPDSTRCRKELGKVTRRPRLSGGSLEIAVGEVDGQGRAESVLNAPPADHSVGQQSRRTGEQDRPGWLLGIGRESLGQHRLVDKQVESRVTAGSGWGLAGWWVASHQEDRASGREAAVADVDGRAG